MKTLIFFCCFIIVWSSLNCSWGESAKPSGPKEDSIYTVENAAKRAQENIVSGDLYLLTSGKELPTPVFDKETGLKIETIGCEAGEKELKYIEKYNELIRNHIKLKKNPESPSSPLPLSARRFWCAVGG